MESICDTCSASFIPSRSDTRYCSGRCRQVAYRKRHRPEDATPRRRRPLPDVYFETVRQLHKGAVRLTRLSADDRFPRNRKELSQQYVSDLMRVRDGIDKAIADLSQSD